MSLLALVFLDCTVFFSVNSIFFSEIDYFFSFLFFIFISLVSMPYVPSLWSFYIDIAMQRRHSRQIQ